MAESHVDWHCPLTQPKQLMLGQQPLQQAPLQHDPLQQTSFVRQFQTHSSPDAL
ncbi:MAG: hypothetical protein LLF76_09640 [Planctomycetaceae bacterium]|nr:hypothetical protein [Planctomycetaceae bacterium]